MSAAPTNLSDDTVPFPLRYWWLKRLLLAGAVVLVALFGLRIWWGLHTHRQLQAEVDRWYLATGGRIYWEDFNSKSVPDEENAARVYARAFALVNLKPAEHDVMIEWSRDRASRARYALDVVPIVARHSEALALAREARSLTGLDWGTPQRNSDVFEIRLPSQAYTIQLLGARAAMEFDGGDHRSCVETVLDMLSTEIAISEHPNALNLILTLGIDEVVCPWIETIAPKLHAGTETVVAPGGQSYANRSSVRAAIGILIDGDYIRKRVIRELRADRLRHLAYDSILNVRLRDEAPPPLRRLGMAWWKLVRLWVMRPVYQRDALAYLRDTATFLSLLDARHPPARWQDHLLDRRGTTEPGAIELLLRPIRCTAPPWLDRKLVIAFRAITFRRMAGTALALRLFEIELGRRPDSLAELVPEYLQSIPIDPLSLDGKALGYLPNAEKPILYSVGDDGVDNGGLYGDAESPYPDWSKSGRDYPFFLNGDRPIEPPKPLKKLSRG